jgi:AAHS family 4-hydroxybenzoate transporter-like MFS transporter
MLRTIDLDAFLESRRLGRFHVLVAALGFLILMVDGLDNSAGTVSAPAIIRAFHVQRGAMGMVFGAGSFGAILGALFFGYVADKWGRKPAIVGSVFAYSLSALASAHAGSLHELMALRFVTGMGVAGVVPTTIALLTETAPRQYRASFIMLTLIGIAAGNGTAGLVAAALLAPYGWPAVFAVAGSIGAALGVALIFVLPESARWLAVAKPEAPQLRRLVVRLAPELDLDAAARFALTQAPRRRVALAELFEGHRRLATPLLWVGYFAEALTFMTLLGWMTVFMVSAGLDQTHAALTFSYASLGGVGAILAMALGRVLDRIGPMALVATATGAVVSVAMMGFPGLSHAAVVACAVASVAFCTATHNALNGTVGFFYPTAIRGKGVGLATGMGRVGLLVGPVATGYLLSVNLPLQQVLYCVAVPYVVVAIACGLLGRLYVRRFSANALDATAAATAAGAASPALRPR